MVAVRSYQEPEKFFTVGSILIVLLLASRANHLKTGERSGAKVVVKRGIMNKNVLCDYCQTQRGKGRKDKGHEFLKFIRSSEVRSIQGTSGETYYKCSICGHEWLHETGNCGMGWIE